MAARLTAVRRAVVLLLVVAVCSAVAPMARDAGAFGCEYRDRRHLAVWRLAATTDPSPLRVRIGDGVRLDSTKSRRLLDVVVSGGAGLAAGTQNGTPDNPDYVFTVTATGVATVHARTADGRDVTGVLQATC